MKHLSDKPPQRVVGRDEGGADIGNIAEINRKCDAFSSAWDARHGITTQRSFNYGNKKKEVK